MLFNGDNKRLKPIRIKPRKAISSNEPTKKLMIASKIKLFFENDKPKRKYLLSQRHGIKTKIFRKSILMLPSWNSKELFLKYLEIRKTPAILATIR